MKDTEELGRKIGHALGAVIAVTAIACIAAICIASTIKIIAWLF